MKPLKSLVRRNETLDFLRGVCIFLVVCHHLGIRLPLKQTSLAAWIPDSFLHALTWCGQEAVMIFFVLSGFLITSRILDRFGSLQALSIVSFYQRRAARILPLLLLLLIVLSILHFLKVPDYVIDNPSQSLAGAILSALGFCLNWYEGKTGYLPGAWDVLWSLSIEEVFYLGFPLVCLYVPSKRLLAVGMGFLACSLPFTLMALREAPRIWQEKAYLPGMAAIAMGVLAALLKTESFFLKKGRFSGIFYNLGLLGITLSLLAKRTLWQQLGEGAAFVLTFSTGLFLLGQQETSWLKGRFFIPGTPWFCSMGRLSYEIYLTHMFVVLGAVRLFQAQGFPVSQAFWLYPPVLVLSWALGAFASRFLNLISKQKEEAEAHSNKASPS